MIYPLEIFYFFRKIEKLIIKEGGGGKRNKKTFTKNKYLKLKTPNVYSYSLDFQRERFGKINQTIFLISQGNKEWM